VPRAQPYSARTMTAAPGANHHRVLILGSGPAGLTAAIYAARANLAPVVVEGSQPGGQLTITTDVENYPGFAEGVLGPEMMEIFKKQAARFGTEFLYGDITDVELAERPFRVTLAGEEHLCDSMVIATGATAKLLGLPGEHRLMGYGVSACATCDGFFFKGKRVAVVGGGDTAMEEATFLTKFATTVSVLHRRDELRASKIMQDRARRNSKIEFVWNVVPVDVLGDPKDGGITAVVLEDTKTKAHREMPIDGLFIAIGPEPNTKLFAGKLTMDDRGYVITEPRSTYTSVPGVFACGDAQDPTYRQAVTAAGSGCMAAIDAERWLEAQHG
jgi:thioredoxin reductase (NADPH)